MKTLSMQKWPVSRLVSLHRRVSLISTILLAPKAGGDVVVNVENQSRGW